jgi:L-2-hydroxyglutarate oxidase LhgO
VLDVAGYCLSLQGDAEDAGAVFAFNSPVLGVTIKDGGGFIVQTGTGNANPTTASETCECDIVINCAGLGATKVARRVHNAPDEHMSLIPEMGYAKGEILETGGRKLDPVVTRKGTLIGP